MNSPLNFQTLYELDVNPGGVASYKRLGAGVTGVTPSNNETVSDKGYMDGDGGKSSRVTGFQFVQAVAADRIPGDAAQDFVFDKLFKIGDNRSTHIRMTEADGAIITGNITIANIVPPGGEAGVEGACSFDMKYNGKPARTPPATAPALTVTVAAGTVAGTTKATVEPGVGNHLGIKLTSAALTQNDRQYVDDYTSYTSAADIKATAAQYLNVWELDAFNHLVKFVSHLLASGDINPGT